MNNVSLTDFSLNIQRSFRGFNDLQKAILIEILEKARRHKYIRREGTPGNYTYFYADDSL